jgi:hypothetical protein
MNKIKRTLVAVICAHTLAPLTGCQWLMMRNFHKGTEIMKIDIGRAHTISRSIDLPAGEADISFVVRDYDCKPLNVSIKIEVQLANGTIKQQDVNLDELTWPSSGTYCRPIGYLRVVDDSNYTRPLRFKINRESNPVRFSVTVTQAADATRQMSIWAVYNARNPVDRMLGTQDP